MRLFRLVTREIAYRKLDFALGVLAVVTAVACLVSVMTLLQAHADRLAELNAAKEKETEARMRQVEEDYRVITKGLGYNVLILSKDQDLGRFLADGYATVYMPEAFVEQLAGSEILTIQHLLPQLYEKTQWPEQGNHPIILIGIRGQVPHLRDNRKEPILNPVAPGTMRIGSVLQQNLGLNTSDKVTLMGQDFTVAEIVEPKGTTDDITVWIPLADAQRLLNQPGQINAILALSCVCAGADLAGIRNEIGRLLPDTQVIQLAPQAAARYATRTRAAALSQETSEAEAAHHARLKREREALAAWLVPLVIVGAMVWIGLLAFGNVRERRAEIGLWRALGLRSGQILTIFLSKAVTLGLVGAVAGYAAGYIIGLGWSASEGVPISLVRSGALFNPMLLLALLVMAPFLAAVGSWIPAVLASQQDPAVVLREE